MNSKEARKKAKQAVKETGLQKRLQFLWLTCILCNKPYHIRVNDKNLYTDEIIKKWVCPLCK